MHMQILFTHGSREHMHTDKNNKAQRCADLTTITCFTTELRLVNKTWSKL